MTQNVPLPGTPLCAVDELRDGEGRVFTWGTGKTAFGVIVLRRGEDITAYVNSCPHFQIPLDHRAKVTMFREFVLCSHHYAAFRASDGFCVEGPCEGGSLAPMPIAIDRGRITIAGDPAAT